MHLKNIKYSSQFQCSMKIHSSHLEILSVKWTIIHKIAPDSIIKYKYNIQHHQNMKLQFKLQV